MLHHLIFILALIVGAVSVLSFWLFAGAGLLLLGLLFSRGGNILDLYRIRRLERRSEVLPRPGPLRPLPPRRVDPLASDTTAAQITDPEPDNADDLALILAASIDESS